MHDPSKTVVSSLGRSHAPPPLQSSEITAQKHLGAQSRRGGVPAELSMLIPFAQKLFQEMLSREGRMAGEWGVFYHSFSTPAFVYEVQAAVAKVLFGFGSEYCSLPRLLKQPFEALPDASAVLKTFPSWPDKDHNPSFKKVGICCSTSLVSSDPEATPTQVFVQGYGASQVGVDVLCKLLQDCGAGLSGGSVQDLANKIMSLGKKYSLPQASGGGSPGHLLQIFIHRSRIDKYVYASLPYGVLDASRNPISKHLAGQGPIRGQVRVVVNPSAFMRASTVRMYSYSAEERFHSTRKDFQEELMQVLSPILGSADVRERAAKGIYNGSLPHWWKDLKQ